jgi:hypothetical protein
MAYKWSMLLSLIFVFQLLLMSGDIATTQVIHGHMMAVATKVSQDISLKGSIQVELTQWVESKNMTITCLSVCNPLFGDTLTFQLTQTFTPLIMSNQPIEVSVIRYAIIGLYY